MAPFCSGAAGTVAVVLAGITAPFVEDDFSVCDRTVTSVDLSFCSGAAGILAAVLAEIIAPFVTDDFSVWDRTVTSVDLSCLEFAVCDEVESTFVAETTGVSVTGVGVGTSPRGFDSSSSGGDIVGSGPCKIVRVNQRPVFTRSKQIIFFHSLIRIHLLA